jgi:phage-related minor tail protein
MGNVGAESAFNPAAVGDGGKALGLAQWNDRGPAMAAAVPDWRTNPQGQLDFMSKEFATTETGSWNKLMASTDVRSATSAVAGYERPRGYSAANPEGADNFSGRLQGADQAMQKFGQTTNSASKNIDTLSTGAIDASKALNSGSNSISNSAGTLASQTAEVPAQSQGLFSSLFSSLGKGLSGLTSGIGSIFSSIFSGLFADGAAFSGGSVVAFASGGIVDRPTMFGMSGGRTGLMGEAGPEAIMPLQRGPGGKLGVAAAMPRQVRQSGGEMKISMSSSNSLHIYGTSDAERDAQWRQGTQLLLDQRDKQWRDNFPDMAEAWRKNPHDRMSS